MTIALRRFAAVGLALMLAACSGPVENSATPAASAAPPAVSAAPAATPAPAAVEPARLVGSWLRTDSPYLISIESVTPEGKLLARYLNPQPINVSRAEWKRDAGRLAILVELNDRGYPGSFYELKYDPSSDMLFGLYHHLGLRQDFEVGFARQGPPAGAR